MTEPFSLLRSTQKRLHSLIDGDLSLRVMPYLGSLLFIELFYAVIKLSFIYGFGPGIVSGITLFAGLFFLVLLSALGYGSAMLILIVICEIHAAFSFSSVFLSVFPGHGADPILLVAYRAVLFPCEAVVSILAVRCIRRVSSR